MRQQGYATEQGVEQPFTAVFTGDKFPTDGPVHEVELKHWKTLKDTATSQINAERQEGAPYGEVVSPAARAEQVATNSWVIKESRLTDGRQFSLVGYENPAECGVVVRSGDQEMYRFAVPREGRGWREVVNQARMETEFESIIQRAGSEVKKESTLMVTPTTKREPRVSTASELGETLSQDVQEMLNDVAAALVRVQQFSAEVDKMNFPPFPPKGEKREEVDREEEEEGEEKKEKEKVPEPVKALDEAKKDLKDVIKDLTEVQKDVKDVVSSLSVARKGRRFDTRIRALATKAAQIIDDGEEAITHWMKTLGPLKKQAGLQPPQGGGFAAKVREIGEAITSIGWLRNLLGTYIPPTEAKDTGDKWPEKTGDSAQVELRAWKGGAGEFESTKSKEDKNPNPATDPRLIDEGSPHDPAPHINSTLVRNKDIRKTAWVVTDQDSGQRLVFSFADVCKDPKAVTAENYTRFTSPEYQKDLLVEVQRDGFLKVARTVGGRVARLLNPKFTSQRQGAEGETVKVDQNVMDKALDKVEKAVETMRGETVTEPSGEKKGTQRQGAEGEKEYYTKMYGNEGYAADLTKDYTTQVAAAKAAADRAVRLARIKASRGLIPFDKIAILAAAKEYQILSEPAYAAVEQTLNLLPVKNQLALTAQYIPDRADAPESGVVGNRLTGVSEPKGKVTTEGLPADVSGDAKIARTAAQRTGLSFIPQLSVESAGVPEANPFMKNTTVYKVLQRYGRDAQQYCRAHYRNHS